MNFWTCNNLYLPKENIISLAVNFLIFGKSVRHNISLLKIEIYFIKIKAFSPSSVYIYIYIDDGVSRKGFIFMR